MHPAFRVASLALTLAVPLASADETPTYDRASFTVEDTREVENDRVTALLAVSDEDADPAQLAERINRDMSWALDIATAESEVKVRTTSYSTQPFRDPKRGVTRLWRGSQQLRIEGSEAEVVSALIGRLQEKLELQDLAFSVSMELRRKVENELIGEVLEAFKRRATLVQSHLGGAGYRVVAIRIDTGHGAVPLQRMRTMGAAAEMDAAPPALEAGTSTLQVRADATIEIAF